MKISARIQWGGSEVIFHHLRSRVEDVIYFLYKPQSQLSKIEKKRIKSGVAWIDSLALYDFFVLFVGIIHPS